MRLSLIALVLSLMAVANADAASKATHAVPDPWELERSKTNEYGFYPVPEFLREAGLRPPPGSPRIKGERSESGVAYRTARQVLIRQGFVPVKVLSQDYGSEICGGTGATCSAFPETLQCTAGGMQHCAFLYRQRATGRYWIVSTIGEEGVAPGVDFRRLRCCGYRPATEHYLEGVAILRSNGRPFRFQYPHPPQADTTPLCRDNGGATPCWIKPPPGLGKKGGAKR
jgi:hypothetical protein